MLGPAPRSLPAPHSLPAPGRGRFHWVCALASANASLTLRLGQVGEGILDLGQRALMEFAVPDNALRVDDEQRAVCNTGSVIEDAKAAGNAAVWPKIR